MIERRKVGKTVKNCCELKIQGKLEFSRGKPNEGVDGDTEAL